LVIVESTIQPGTTRNVLIPILEKEAGLGRDQFLVAYSPERIDPANKTWKIGNTPKLVAGLT
jgi:UDP-N-acetyl-D-mannosaminuronate dehydrogenase